MEKFKSFITEQKDEPYRMVVLIHDTKDEPDITGKRIKEEADKQNLECYRVELDGAYSTRVENKRYIHSRKDKKGFLVDPNNTMVFVRGSVTDKKSWSDLVTQFERDNIVCVNSRHCFEICSDKFRTSLFLADNDFRQPKTVLINHKEDAIQSFKRLDTDFPVILKTLEGSMGIGVIMVENESALNATVQLSYKLDPKTDLLLQEYIETDFDVRVIVLNGEVHGAIKRPIAKDDFRSNVSQGSIPESFELTELEKQECIKAAKLVDGIWCGTDFIPSKDREKDKPIFIEINSSPGTEGYEKATGENLVNDVINQFKNRYNWLRPKPFRSIYGDNNENKK